MAKQHLVEKFSTNRETYKNLTNDAKFSNLLESAKKFHKGTSLNESVVKGALTEAKIDAKMQQQVLKNLKEAGASDDVELWQFPISKINDRQHPNLNGRVYGRKLWENVINKQQEAWKGGTGLANHPEGDSDGDFMNQSIVWLDGFIGDDGIVYGIGTLVGAGGELARQIIGVGGRVGFSTSGYGDLIDGVEVDPEGYEIERLADLVLNPSQGVFGDHNDAVPIGSVPASEVVGEKETNESVQHESVQKKGKVMTESVKKEDTEIPFTEQLVLDHYSGKLKEIAKRSNSEWEDKIACLEKLVSQVKKEKLSESTVNTFNSQIQSMIEAIMKDAHSAIKEGFLARELCSALNLDSVSKLNGIQEKLEDFASLQECLDKTSKEAAKYKKLYEEKSAYAVREATDSYEADNKIDELKDQLKEQTNNNKKLVAENAELSKKLDDANELTENLQFENKSINEELEDTSRKLNAQIAIYNKLKEQKLTTDKKLTESIKTRLTQSNSLKEQAIEITKKSALVKSQSNSLREKMDTIQDLEESVENLTSELSESKATNDRLRDTVTKLRNNILSLRESITRNKELLTESDKTVRSLQKSNSQLKAKITEDASTIADLNSENEELSNLVESWKNKHAKAESSLKRTIREAKETIQARDNAAVKAKKHSEAQLKEAMETKTYGGSFLDDDTLRTAAEDYGVDSEELDNTTTMQDVETASLYNNTGDLLDGYEEVDDPASAEAKKASAEVTTLQDLFN